jgi:hypothetical protein
MRADKKSAMDLTIEEPTTAPVTDSAGHDGTVRAVDDGTEAAPPEEAEEIRGMMPSFNVWQEAQHALKFERAAATVARERERAAAKKRRWPLVVAICAVIVVALVVERSGGGGTPLPTASTPVEKLPWRIERPASRAFRVSLPADAESSAVATAAGTGEQLEAKLAPITITVGAFEVAGPSQARSLVEPILQERARALDGRVERLQGVGTRAGAGFESVIRTTAPVAIVRVIIDGAMMYVIELRGDVDAPRTKQIYDRVVLSFTAGG